MKKLLVAACCISLFIGCSRKTVPSKPNYSLNNGNNNKTVITDSSAVNNNSADSAKAASSFASYAVMVIADGYGKLITPQDSLPQDASIKYNNLQLSKGFTAQQLANLQARYHTVPPRVLYVPQQNSSSSLKGNYYVYKKKFWYWKKSDGFYYLDQKYYL
jgi:hypothetical protein